MPLTPEVIASIPPCSSDQLKSLANLLGDVEERLKDLPPEIARLILFGTFTRSQWEMFVKSARWMDNNDALKELPGPLLVWLQKAVAAGIVDEDNGEAVPE